MTKGRNYLSNQTKVAENCLIESPIRTYGSVEIKKGSKVGRFSFINNRTTIFADTTIGRYCSIGKSCEIGAFDHPLDWASTSPVNYNMKLHFPAHDGLLAQFELERPPGPVIGHDVWIGSLVVIRRGVTIGHGAVVAANSVVTHDVPPYAIVGGAVAKTIRYRFSGETIAKLLALKWWELPTEQLNGLPFNNVEAFIAGVAQIRQNQTLEAANQLDHSHEAAVPNDSNMVQTLAT